LLITYALFILLFWLSAGQCLGDLPSYIRNSLRIASGYDEAMSFTSPLSQPIWYLVTTAVFLVIFCKISWTCLRLDSLFSILAVLLPLALLYKSVFVRHDQWHFFLATDLIPGYAMLSLPFLWKETSTRTDRCLAGVFIALAIGGGVWGKNLEGYTTITYLKCRAKTLVANAAGVSRTVLDPRHLRRDYESTRDDIRKEHPLPRITGTVDCYPSAIGLVNSYADMRYDPRSSIQSCMAYDADVLRANAIHLVGNRAPEYILFRVEPIDNRYPAMDDSLTWLQILAHYHLSSTTPEYLIFKHSPYSRSYKLTKIVEQEIELGKPMTIPTRQFVWVRMYIKTTFWGKVLRMAYHLPSLKLSITTANENRKGYRLISPIAATGFLLSPVIQQSVDFADFSSFCIDRMDERWDVKEIEVGVDGGSNVLKKGVFQPHINIELFRLEPAS
jgi:hypothetical protein